MERKPAENVINNDMEKLKPLSARRKISCQRHYRPFLVQISVSQKYNRIDDEAVKLAKYIAQN